MINKTEQTPEATCAASLKECFYLDKHEINPIPRGMLRKTILLFLSHRYSMPVLMRLIQYYYLKSRKPSKLWKIYYLIFLMLRRANGICNNFEHGANPYIAAGVVFHHYGVCITSNTIIESGVHIYRNVLFGKKNGGSPIIKKNAKIASHSVVIGNVIVGENAIVAPGAIVVKDVPPGKIAAGVPARIIGDVTDDNYAF